MSKYSVLQIGKQCHFTHIKHMQLEKHNTSHQWQFETKQKYPWLFQNPVCFTQQSNRMTEFSIAILWWRRDWAHTVSALFRVNGTLVFSVCRNLTICLLFSIMSTESQLGAPICNSSPCNVWVAERTRKFNQIFIYLFRQWTFSSL